MANEAAANGPRRIVLPLRVFPIRDATEQVLRAEIERALSEFVSLGKSIPASEWKELNAKFLEAVHVESTSTFEKRKRGITVRADCELGHYTIFGEGKGLDKLEENVSSIGEVVFKIQVLLLRLKPHRVSI